LEGNITVSYVILCDDDIQLDIDIRELLANEKIARLIKNEYAKGARNLLLDSSRAEGTVSLSKEKALHTFVIAKDDFADALSLAEEDARTKKLLKGKCTRIELIDLATE
jgi:hypothetical protein